MQTHDVANAPLPPPPVPAPSVPPDSSTTGYYASWDQQASYFRDGVPIACNAHHRRYTFGDGSYVTIQAHVPMPLHSVDAQLQHGRDWFGAIVIGTAAGLCTFNPVGLLAGVTIGAITGWSFMSYQLPADVSWQGYTARYYRADEPAKLYGVRYFYGYSTGSEYPLAVQVDTPGAAAPLPDFADRPHDYSWWRWRSGEAQVRRPERAVSASARQSAEQIVQAMGALTPPAQAGAAIGTPPPPLADASLQLVVPG